jgi:hypothetical protein
MTTKLHIIVLDPDGAVLGWTAVEALARGDGQLHATAPVVVIPDRTGQAHTVIVHWVDVNVELRTTIPLIHVDRAMTVFQSGPIFRVGPQAGGLPSLEIKTAVRISPDVGALVPMGTS